MSARRERSIGWTRDWRHSASGAPFCRLIEAPIKGWRHPTVVASLAGGCAALGLFLLVQARSAAPMLPLRMFRSRNFGAANLLALWLYAALLAIAVLGIVMTQVFNRNLDERLRSMSVAPATLQAIDAERDKLAGAMLPPGLDASTHAALRQAIDASFIAGYRRTMVICAALALLSALSAWLMIRGTDATAPKDAEGSERGR